MKNKSSLFSLKVLIIIAVVVGITVALVSVFRMLSPISVAMFLGMATPALIIAFQLYKLVDNSEGTEIISRENLKRVKRIQLVLLLMLGIKTIAALASSLYFMSFLTILMLPLGILFSSWELLVGILIIHILARVFERALILKEEEALTI